MFANKWRLQSAFSLSLVAPWHQVNTVNSFHNAGTYSHVIFHVLQTVTGTAFDKLACVIKNSSVHCISACNKVKSVCIKIISFVHSQCRKKTRNWDQCSMSDKKTFYHFLFSCFHLCPAYGFTSQNIQSSFPDIFSVRKCFTKIKFARNVLSCLVAWTAVEYEHQLWSVSVYKNWAAYWDVVRQKLKWNLQHTPKLLRGIFLPVTEPVINIKSTCMKKRKWRMDVNISEMRSEKLQWY